MALAEKEKIHKPELEITYQAVETEHILPTSTEEASYFMDYYQGEAAFERVVAWVVGLGGGLLALGLVIGRMAAFRARHPIEEFGD